MLLLAGIVAIAVPQFRAMPGIYGWIPLTKSLVAYMKAHGPRFPPSWQALDPYLTPAAHEAAFFASSIEESHVVAWTIDPVALYRTGSCASGGRPIIVSRRNDRNPEGPWCFDDQHPAGLAVRMRREGFLPSAPPDGDNSVR